MTLEPPMWQYALNNVGLPFPTMSFSSVRLNLLSRSRAPRTGTGKWSDAIAHITHGAAAAWLVKPDLHEVVVVTSESRAAYRRGDELDVLGEARLPVDSILNLRPLDTKPSPIAPASSGGNPNGTY